MKLRLKYNTFAQRLLKNGMSEEETFAIISDRSLFDAKILWKFYELLGKAQSEIALTLLFIVTLNCSLMHVWLTLTVKYQWKDGGRQSL